MSRNLSQQTNIIAPTSDYPSGRIKDDTGAADGTPVNEAVYGDIHQFFAKLLRDASITPNNQPDNTTNGFQLFDAFYTLAISKPLEFAGIFQHTYTTVNTSGTTANNPIFSDREYIYFSEVVSPVGIPPAHVVRRLNKKTSAINTVCQFTNAPKDIFVDDDYIYVIRDNSGLNVFNKTTGANIPSKAIIINSTLKGLCVYDGVIYIGDVIAGHVKRYDQSTLAQQASMGSGLSNITCISGGYKRLFVNDLTSANKTVLVFNTTTGNQVAGEQWIPDGTNSTTITRVYGGRIYCMVKTGSTRQLLVFQLVAKTPDIYRILPLNNDVEDFYISHNTLVSFNPTTKNIYTNQQVWAL